MGVYFNDREAERLNRKDPLLQAAYFWLRGRMDHRTGIVGRVTKISLQALAENLEYEVPKGQGHQLVKIADTAQRIKDKAVRILERLERLGLIRKLGGAFLCFLCPLCDGALARQNQTGHERATVLSTERARFDRTGNCRRVVRSRERATHHRSRKTYSPIIVTRLHRSRRRGRF
jgi:hypothetical protein